MEPTLERDDHILRVDGDVLEVFDVRCQARRIPLKWLAVRVETLRKNRMVIYIGQNNVDQPLYAEGKQTPDVRGDVLSVGIEAEEEPPTAPSSPKSPSSAAASWPRRISGQSSGGSARR